MLHVYFIIVDLQSNRHIFFFLVSASGTESFIEPVSAVSLNDKLQRAKASVRKAEEAVLSRLTDKVFGLFRNIICWNKWPWSFGNVYDDYHYWKPWYSLCFALFQMREHKDKIQNLVSGITKLDVVGNVVSSHCSTLHLLGMLIE